MNRRLVIIIIVLIIILSGVAGVLFWAVQKQNQTPPPETSQPVIEKVLDEITISPVASFDGNAIWYFNAEGRLFRVNLDGSGISEFPLPQLDENRLRRILWPKTGSDFIAVTGSGGNEIKSFYDSVLKNYLKLPENIQSLDWLPDSKRVVYIWKSSDNVSQQLVMADGDGSGYTPVKDVFWPDLIVKAGPDGKTVLMYRATVPGETNKIYDINLDTGVIKTTLEAGKNTGAVWLPLGSKFIFAQRSVTAFPKLFLYDFITRQATDLDLSTNLDKITFDKDGKYLYAAVPKPDNSSDNFIRVDLATFQKETYFEPTESVHGVNLLMLGSQLYFVNSQDQKLYTISK
ncbi:MAG: hypothetical protein A2660_03060 [Candidatus Doudnabacteria bacterium RIFCSPHIGHO2_01_FULL_45_18]|uniref:Dipeptidylpeptidase IV N-terminal domain-containing protein n=1 Tax=Candidatus Doudnabacteria bacterium RIFCSPHIGHO2_01_FULL_45_18 TaxID=1817823 RepID=A0A1F5NQ07_9BACT|nr:MAG: hypothetical protein A2660_03060 [Candidatus Doudnabacteria bacterium RIFCSPHIGHO2_01_FULL_45_18]